MSIEPFNPARHGGVLESFSAHSRSGFISLFIGIFSLVTSFFVFFLWFGNSTMVNVLFWLLLLIGIVFTVFGIFEVTSAQEFNSRVRRLKNDGDVTRGSIQSVHHTYRFFGRTMGTGRGDSIGMETGWYFKIWYTFDDGVKLRRATGIIPDELGPKRRNTSSSTFLDNNRPRTGMMVDVLFDNADSVVLRLIDPT